MRNKILWRLKVWQCVWRGRSHVSQVFVSSKRERKQRNCTKKQLLITSFKAGASHQITEIIYHHYHCEICIFTHSMHTAPNKDSSNLCQVGRKIMLMLICLMSARRPVTPGMYSIIKIVIKMQILMNLWFNTPLKQQPMGGIHTSYTKNIVSNIIVLFNSRDQSSDK